MNLMIKESQILIYNIQEIKHMVAKMENILKLKMHIYCFIKENKIKKIKLKI